MTLHEALKSIPGDTLLRSALDRSEATAAKLLTTVRDESGCEVNHGKRNYGKDSHITIYFPGIGILFSEA
jgi:hypothetical protein